MKILQKDPIVIADSCESGNTTAALTLLELAFCGAFASAFGDFIMSATHFFFVLNLKFDLGIP
jgi:hypothetical protein